MNPELELPLEQEMNPELELPLELDIAAEKKDLKLFSAKEIVSESTEENEDIIKNLLPRGLSILASAPKVGKSWLVLAWAINIASGKSIWGYRVKKTAVLYFCLEDTKERLKKRILTISNEIPENLFLCFQINEKIGKGIEEIIINTVNKNRDIELIIIDVFTKIRSNFDLNYSKDYEELSKLKTIADKLNIAILLVHHTRKLVDHNDPLNNVSGTTGIAGVVDSTLVLIKENRNSNVATLTCVGREIEQKELKLRFELGKWILISDSSKNPELLLPKVLQDLIIFLKSINYSYEGGNQEFTNKLNEFCSTNYPANYVKRCMNAWKNDLLLFGICFQSGTKPGARTLKIWKKNDIKTDDK